MSPGAPSLDVDAPRGPRRDHRVGLTMPTARSAAYVEIDDAAGRAWAATPAPVAQADGDLRGQRAGSRAHAGALLGGRRGRPGERRPLSAGTLVRPFFVASSDEAALAFGTDRAGCAPPRDPRETASALSSCLALSAIAPVARWTALDGFVMQRAQDGEARARASPSRSAPSPSRSSSRPRCSCGQVRAAGAHGRGRGARRAARLCPARRVHRPCLS